MFAVPMPLLAQAAQLLGGVAQDQGLVAWFVHAPKHRMGRAAAGPPVLTM
jgi:hypothetical protein